MTRICLVTLLALMTACSSQQQMDSSLASFVSQDVKSVISELGRPSETHDMQNGSWAYVWNRQS